MKTAEDVGAALATLRRCAEALAREPSAAERERLSDLHEQALKVLEQSDTRHRPGTLIRLTRLQQLERQLSHMAPGARAAAIRERLGLSKSGYYKLRQLALGPRMSGKWQ